MSKPKEKYFLYYPEDDLEDFDSVDKVIKAIENLQNEVYTDDFRVIIGRELRLKQTFKLEE